MLFVKRSAGGADHASSSRSSIGVEIDEMGDIGSGQRL